MDCFNLVASTVVGSLISNLILAQIGNQSAISLKQTEFRIDSHRILLSHNLELIYVKIGICPSAC